MELETFLAYGVIFLLLNRNYISWVQSSNISAIEGYGQSNQASLQLPTFAQNTQTILNYTRADGVPIYDIFNSERAGRNGPLVMEDSNFLDAMQHFDRERIPERIVHAKGAGAFGHFVCTNDMSAYTQAGLLTEIGKKTPVAVRFSRISGSLGDADTVRDARGFAIKFYTGEGNWDLVGLNFPIFWIRDAMRFPSLIHSQKRNPVTNLFDPTMYWDLLSLLPETLPMILNVFSDNGIPLSYRTMNGHSVNILAFTRPDGNATFVRFHLITNQGVFNIPPDQASVIAGIDGDFHTRDLYNNIAKGNFPSWNVSAQLLSIENAKTLGANAFDPTKMWPPSLVNMVPIGVLQLNTNPSNFFAQIEQLGFDPGRLVPGIEPSVDPILQGRLFSYTDTLTYRLGVNHELLPVNRPLTQVANGERDGFGRSDDNQGGAPNYFPNSFNGPQGNAQFKRTPYPVNGVVKSFNQTDADNYSQPSKIWGTLTEAARNTISNNIAQSLSRAPQFIQERAINNFNNVSPDWGQRVLSALNQT